MVESRRTCRAWPWLVAMGLIVIAFYPTWRWLVQNWLGNPYYGHGFLVPPVAGWLAWRLRRTGPTPTPAQGIAFWLALAGLALGLGAHVLALAYGGHLASALCLLLVIGATVSILGGQVLRRMSFPLAFLLFMIPLPWLERSTPALARAMASAAAWGLQGLGIPVVAVGARVELPGTALAIGAPCSGVNSLAAMVTLTALYAFLVYGTRYARIALVVLAVPIALSANLLRVALLVVLAHYAGAKSALDAFHTWSGPVLFLAACGALVAAGKGLGCNRIRGDI